MAMSRTLVAYADCQMAMDRALDSAYGIALPFETVGSAVHFRQRCYSFRKLINEQAEGEKESGIYSGSSYDTLIVSLDGKVIKIRVRDVLERKIVELRS